MTSMSPTLAVDTLNNFSRIKMRAMKRKMIKFLLKANNTVITLTPKRIIKNCTQLDQQFL